MSSIKKFALFFFLISHFFMTSQSQGLEKENNLSLILNKIEELKSKALKLSPDLKIAQNFHSQKKAEGFTQISRFLPAAHFSLKKEKDFFEDRNTQLRSLGIGGNNATWGIDYQWALFNYGLIQNTHKTFIEKEKAALLVFIKEKEYPITFNTYFLNLLLAKYKKSAVLNSLQKAATLKKEATLGFELGQKTKIDVLRSEANMVSLDSKKTTYANEEHNAKSTFLEFSGLKNEDLTFIENLSENEMVSLINSLCLLPNNLIIDKTPIFSKGPLLENLNLEEKINTLALSNLTNHEWPELKIQGSYHNAGNSWKDATHSPSRTHTVALILTIPILGGGNSFSSHFEEYFSKKQIQFSIAKKRQETENQLNNTLTKIKALETLVSSLSINVSLFEELNRLTLKSYQLGKSSYLELLEVQDNLLDSKISFAQNKIQYYTLTQNYLWQAGLQ